MFIRAYLPPILTALFGGLFVFLGVVTFGNALAFDSIYVSLLIFTGVVCRKDINVVSVIFILLIQLLWESLAWNILVDDNILKIILYMIALFTSYYFRYDLLAKIVATIVIVVIASELYWYSINYTAPEIYWYVSIMISNLFIRHLIFCRVSFVNKYYPNEGESVNLDWVIYKFNAALTILPVLMVIEYLSRHLLGFNEILVIYYSYSYIIHFIGTITIWVIFTEASKHLIPKLLRA